MGVYSRQGMISAALKAFIWQVCNSKFARQVLVLSAGTLLAQVLLLLASPVLTRIYTPEDFGIYAFLLGCVSVLSPAICGKYDQAILLPRSNRSADALSSLSVQICVLFSLILFVVICVMQLSNLMPVGFDSAGSWILTVPLLLFLTGISMVVMSVATRIQRYELASKGKVIQSVCIITTNVALGLAGCGFEGLILGNIVGLVVFNYFLNRRMKFHPGLRCSKRNWLLSRRYKEFPIFNASSSLFDGAALNLPIFFISAHYPEAYLGYFALVTRVVNVPLTFISVSVSQINLKKVVTLAHANERILPYVVKLSAALAVIVLPVVLVLIFFSDYLFRIVFGENWGETGKLASLLVPSLGLRFVVSTVSTTITGTNNNKLGMYWKIGSFVSTLVLFLVLAPKGDFDQLMIGYVIMDVILYSIYLLLIFFSAVRPRVDLVG